MSAPTVHVDAGAEEASSDPFQGTPYRAVSRLGAGGMGEVFVVEHRELERHFVAKVLRAEHHDDARTVDRMRVEAESLGRLAHPHIVSVTGSGHTSDGRPFIVMELLQGMTLARALAKRGTLSLWEAVRYARATLSALSAAHQLGIVHRDIKPQNLFLHEAEDGAIVLKVLDFGIARVLPDASSLAPLPLSFATETGTVLGTPRFVSPEAAAGHPVDARADLYGVGLVLYTALAGRGPFDHVERLGDVLAAHASEKPRPPSHYAKRPLPPELDAVVLKALSKQPEARYQSADEFDAELSLIEQGLGDEAAPGAALRGDPPAWTAPQLTPRVSWRYDKLVAFWCNPAPGPWSALALFAASLLVTSFMTAGGAMLLAALLGGMP